MKASSESMLEIAVNAVGGRYDLGGFEAMSLSLFRRAGWDMIRDW